MERNRSIKVEFDKEQYDVLTGLLNDIENRIENGLNVDSEINEFNRIGEKPDFYDFDHMISYHSYTDEDSFIKAILLPKPYKIENITEEEVLMILNLANENGDVESVFDYYLNLLKNSIQKNKALAILNNNLSKIDKTLFLKLKELVEECLLDDKTNTSSVIRL